MSEWVRKDNVYYREEHDMDAMVMFDPDTCFWISRVRVRGEVVDHGEWSSRDSALDAVFHAMRRAIYLRRFDKNCPMMSKSQEDCQGDEDDPE